MAQINLGNTKVKKIYLGNTQIKKVYVGSTKVYSGEETFSVNYPISLAGKSGDDWIGAPTNYVEHVINIPVGETFRIVSFSLSVGGSVNPRYEIWINNKSTRVANGGDARVSSRTYSGSNLPSANTAYTVTNSNAITIRLAGNYNPAVWSPAPTPRFYLTYMTGA